VIAVRAVAAKPDLVLLTGDFLTMESQRARGALAGRYRLWRPCRPIAYLPVGAITIWRRPTRGRRLGRRRRHLLIDEAAVVETPAGPCRSWASIFISAIAPGARGRCARHTRAYRAYAAGVAARSGGLCAPARREADLVFSGQYHGGQLGLLSLDSPYLRERLHQDSRHGFGAGAQSPLCAPGDGALRIPLRVGVPGEESLLRVHWMSDAAAS